MPIGCRSPTRPTSSSRSRRSPGCRSSGFEDQFSEKTGKPLKWPAAVFSFPPQPIDADIEPGSKHDRGAQRAGVGVLQGRRRSTPTPADCGCTGTTTPTEPRGVTRRRSSSYETFHEGAKLDALWELADQMLAGDADRVGHAMLRGDPPRFVAEPDGPDRRRVRRRDRRDLSMGDTTRPQLRADPGAAGHRQDLHRRAHDPHPRERRPTGRRHGDEPSRRSTT